MNFLAHAYLSFNQEHLLVGNLISDFVKGKAQYTYPPAIQTGIRLHRAIDAFTDAHHATKNAMHFFKMPYRLYSGPIVDILYDYYLANDTSIFPGETLFPFSNHVYEVLEKNAAILPPAFARVFTYMKQENWLWNYRKPEGMQKSLNGLMRRATYITDSDTAYKLFLQHHEALGNCYRYFISDVKSFAKQQMEVL